MTGAELLLEGVAKTWPDGSSALCDVDLRVPAGSTLVVLGASGAGKSTLLRIVAGLERADAGRVQLGERTLVDGDTRLPPEQRGVGMVFQALELWPHMSVAEHIAFGLPGRPRGKAAQRHATVQRLMAAVGLDAGMAGRKPGTLSGGEQQRVAIARTLAPEPGVILYDEPLANLDPDRRARLRALIRKLANEHGATVVYVTHDADEALELGDAVAVFADGRLVEHGVPATVYAAPRTLLGAKALGPVIEMPGEVRGGVLTTVLGEHPVGQADGPARGLWRPEQVRVAPEGVPATVRGSTPRGPDWLLTVELGGRTVRATSREPAAGGSQIQVRADAPCAVLMDVAAASMGGAA